MKPPRAVWDHSGAAYLTDAWTWGDLEAFEELTGAARLVAEGAGMPLYLGATRASRLPALARLYERAGGVLVGALFGFTSEV